MQVKKRVIERIVDLLQTEYNKINYEIFENKYKFKNLEHEQTVLKRERVKLQKMINELKGD